MKKIIGHSVVLIAMTLFFIVSCKKDRPIQSLNMGYSYYPNNVGHYVIYNVDSIAVNQFLPQAVDTSRYQIKEVIDAIYSDASGRPTQRIVRYKKSSQMLHSGYWKRFGVATF